MSAVARWMARIVWWYCLWLMRRPWMKALQRRSHFLFPPEKRGRAHESFIRQNAFARRNGVRILTWVFNLILAYIVIGFVFLAVVELNDRGYFTLPDRIARRAHAD